MGSFNKQKHQLEKQAFEYICSIDPSINWDKSNCTQEEYRENTDKHKENLVFSSDPIRFWIELPSANQKLLATGRSGMDYKHEDGKEEVKVTFERAGMSEGIAAAFGLTRLFRELAKLCILKIDNLDDCPEKIRRNDFDGKKILNDEALKLIPEVVLVEIGSYINSQSDLSEEKKMDSSLVPGGVQSKSNQAIKTTVTSVM